MSESKVDWRDASSFPTANGKWEYFRLPVKKIREGKGKIENALRNWNSFDPILVASPESRFFSPAICEPSLAPNVHKRMISQARIVLIYLTLLILVEFVLVCYTSFDDQKIIRILLLTILFLFYFYLDYIVVLKNFEYTKHRAMFVSYIYLSGGKVFKQTLFFMIAILSIQSILLYLKGSFQELLSGFGLLSEINGVTQWWRLLSGPLIHADFIHWSVNLIFMVIAAELCRTVTRNIHICFVVILFLSSFLFVLLPYPGRPDALVGISGGILGLFGYIFWISFVRPSLFPEYFWLTVLSFTFLVIGSTASISSNSSEFIHLVGFVLGIGVSQYSLYKNDYKVSTN